MDRSKTTKRPYFKAIIKCLWYSFFVFTLFKITPMNQPTCNIRVELGPNNHLFIPTNPTNPTILHETIEDFHSNDRILILDFGSKSTNLIAERIRELNVYCEIHPYDMPPDQIVAFNASGIILSGSPVSVYGDDKKEVSNVIFEQQVPILGICYGMQIIAYQLGGSVEKALHSEFGDTPIIVTESKLFENVSESETFTVWMNHQDEVTNLPPEFIPTATSQDCQIAAMENVSKQIYAVQFHPEITSITTEHKVLSNFVYNICGCSNSFDDATILQHDMPEASESIKKDTIVLELSGAINSSSTAA